MSNSRDAKFWLQFFLDAGVPRPTAMQYAITFSENRIDIDMLNDLTKDYLKEMNITVIGDVIAILKHAGKVAKDDYFTRKTPKNYDDSRSAREATSLSSAGRVQSATNSAMDRKNFAPSRQVQPNPGQAVYGSATGAHVPPDAGAYSVFIPAGARRKVIDAESRRTTITAGNNNRLVLASGVKQHQQNVSTSAGSQSQVNVLFDKNLNPGMQNLRVVRSQNGNRRVVTGRTQSRAANQYEADSARSIRTSYMDDSRVNGARPLNRLGKRPQSSSSGIPSLLDLPSHQGFDYNSSLNYDSKRRKLNNVDGYSANANESGMHYRQDAALHSVHNRIGTRTVIATGNRNVHIRSGVRSVGRSPDLRFRLHSRPT